MPKNGKGGEWSLSMRKCPLNNFKDCIREECPFYNIRLGTCVLPRLILSQIKYNELKGELNYDDTNNNQTK